MRSLKLNLVDNARSFIEEALSKAIQAENDPHQWKFAIIHLVQGIELSLKELLRNEHPLFIYKNIDNPKETVSPKEAINRLNRIWSFELSEDENNSLTMAIILRNNIIHHEYEVKPLEVKAAFAKLLGFLVDFHRNHLEDPIDTYIDQNLWHAAIEIEKYGQELFRRAQERLKGKDFASEYILTCPKCGWNALCAPEYLNEGACFVCGHREVLGFCDRCEKLMFEDDVKECGDKTYCWDCFVYLTDDYWHEDGRGKDRGRGQSA
ncbi:MAG: hypothetical protein MUC65_01660 [Pontiellaceae bacterium]|jgi:rubrerythrin|nr:hypothetical protein [Pontiellaceae bacterium]